MGPHALRREAHRVRRRDDPLEATPEDLAAAVDALYAGKAIADGGPIELFGGVESLCCQDTHDAMMRRAERESPPFAADCKCGAAYRLFTRISNVYEQ